MHYHLFGTVGILSGILGITTIAQANLRIANSQTYQLSDVNLVSLATSKPTGIQSPSTTYLATNSLEMAVYQEVNQYRQSRNLPPLVIDPLVSAQAQAHSEKMARTGNLGHDGFDRRINSVAQQIKCRSAAENVASNQGSSRPDLVAIQGWIESPQHRRNLVGSFNLTGIGVAKNDRDEYFFTQIFIHN